MPTAYRYVRYSTDGQSDGDSVRRQDALAASYAARHGLTLAAEPVLDAGVSAFRGANAETGKLRTFLKRITDGQIARDAILLVESFDRITRQPSFESITLMMEILSTGIRLVTLNDERVYDQKNLRFHDLILMLVNMERGHNESDIKSLRGIQSWKHKRKLAAETIYTRRIPAWLNVKEGRIEIIKDRGVVVSKIFELAAGGLGAYAIANHLNKTFIPTFGSSSLWGVSYIKRILKNEATFGRLRFSPSSNGEEFECIDGYYPSVISSDKFFEVASGLRKRGAKGGGRRGIGVSNLFSKIIVCGYCYSAMHYINKGRSPKGGNYLACSKGIRSDECSRSHWRYEVVERMILREISHLVPDEQSRAAMDDEFRASESQIESIKGRISECDTKIDRLISLSQKIDTDLDQISGAIIGLRDEKVALEQRITPLNEKLSECLSLYNQMSSSSDYISRLYSDIDSLDEDQIKLRRMSIQNDITKVVLKLVCYHDVERNDMAFEASYGIKPLCRGKQFIVAILRDRSIHHFALSSTGTIDRMRVFDKDLAYPAGYEGASLGIASHYLDWEDEI